MNTKEALKQYEPIIKGAVALFSPFLEVAVHDIKSGKIIAIYHNLSNRKVGDISPVKELKLPVEKFPDVFEPYFETNWNGHKIKCTTVTVRDEHKKPVLLICFNLDVSVFEEMESNLKTFLHVRESAGNPVELFGENYQKNIDGFISSYLTKHNLIVQNMTRVQKKQLIEDLARHGVFFYKNASLYIAAKLHISRATVYNYLKVLRAG